MCNTKSPIFIQFTCRIPVIIVALINKQSGNSVDPDQLASEKPTDLDLHCIVENSVDLDQSASKVWSL